MREITVKLYQFDELDERAKERARDWYRNDDGMESQYAWEYVIEDAANIGLEIYALDRCNKGRFLENGRDCARRILKDHGDTCETYKTARQFIDGLEAQDEDTIEQIEKDFLYSLLEDYRIMLEKETEYRYSAEVVDETIRANEYEFTEEGKRA